MNLTLGLPNGSLRQTTFDLLSRIGLDIRPNGRSGQVAIEGLNLFNRAVLMRPQDIPLAILQRRIDCGICGLDWLVETELGCGLAPGGQIHRLCELPYRPTVRVILFGRPDSPPISKTTPVSISAEYPNIAHNRYPKANIGFSHGSTEIKVALGQFDYGIGVTVTGSSLRDNDLCIAEELMVSPAVFAARETLPELVFLGELLAGALEADRHQLIKMNVDASIKSAVINALPALRAPTVSPLSDCAFALETIVPKTRTTQILIHLRSLGATGIVVQDVNAILA